MMPLSRRVLLQGLPRVRDLAGLAQQNGRLAPAPFRFEDVVRRARELAALPYESNLQPLPEPLNRLDFDAYRDIRFRNERALLASAGGRSGCTCSTSVSSSSGRSPST